MAKKFGKFLLFTAALGTAAAAAYYYIQKKENEDPFAEDDEDYDDFSEDSQENAEASRNYVSLNAGNGQVSDTSDKEASGSVAEKIADAAEQVKDTFTPLAKQAASAVSEKAEETVEEFFDEDDPTEEESLISEEDN